MRRQYATPCAPPRRMTIAFRHWSPVSCPAGRSKCECRRVRATRVSRRLSSDPGKPKGALENDAGFNEKEIRIFSSGKEGTPMFITKMALERRSFLRGVGATLALPFLDAMTPAFAAPGKAIPRLSFM